MNLYKNRFRLLVIVFIGSFVIFNIMQMEIYPREYGFRLQHGIVDCVVEKLVFNKHVAASKTLYPSENKSFLYVLGGNQGSLTQRYRKASELYHRGLSKNILILSRPGMTEFSHDLGRNLTNDEWSIRELRRLNVKQEDIETVSVKFGFLGTLREAKRVTDIVREIGGERLILVTSSYHTRRAFLSYSVFQRQIPIEIYVYEAEDDAGIINLFSESVKLFMYENIILPVCSITFWRIT